jgi:hypothetical protein
VAQYLKVDVSSQHSKTRDEALSDLIDARLNQILESFSGKKRTPSETVKSLTRLENQSTKTVLI